MGKKEANHLNHDKKKQDKKPIEQYLDNDLQKHEQSSAQTDGIRYEYDDSSNVN